MEETCVYSIGMKHCFAILVMLGSLASVKAEIKSKLVEYKERNTILEGYSVYDDAVQGKRPGVLVVHQWKGLGDYEKKRAEMLARLGYNVFAVDIYGKGVRPKDMKEAGAQAGKYKSDRPLLRERVKAGLEVLQKHELTDTKHI